jgi:hypothetical protein
MASKLSIITGGAVRGKTSAADPILRILASDPPWPSPHAFGFPLDGNSPDDRTSIATRHQDRIMDGEARDGAFHTGIASVAGSGAERL